MAHPRDGQAWGQGWHNPALIHSRNSATDVVIVSPAPDTGLLHSFALLLKR
jgi:hypothetical protein